MNKHYFVQFYNDNGNHIGTRSLTSSTHDEARREAQALLLNSTAMQVQVFANIGSDMFQAYFIDRQTGYTYGPDWDALMKAEASAPCACDHPGDVPAWMRGEQMELD
jgi:hypothetical protein